MTVTKRLFTAGLPAAGIIAAALAFTGQPASAAPADQAIGDAPQVDPAALFGTLTAGLGNVGGVPALPGLPLVGDLQGLPTAQTLPAVGGAQTLPAGAADLPQEAKFEAAQPREAGPMASGAGVSGMLSGDNDGILNGTQIAIPIQIPVNICGTGIGVLGLGAGQGDCGPADIAPPPPPVDEEPPTEEPPTEEPPAQEPPSYGSPGGPEDDELPVTGTPLVGLAGLGGLLTAGGAAMTMVGARTGAGASRYTGRHRSAA